MLRHIPSGSVGLLLVASLGLAQPARSQAPRANERRYCRNEPLGFRPALANPWNALPPAGPATDSLGWQVWNGASRLSIAQDPRAPRSRPAVLRMLFPKGWGDASAPHQFGAALPANDGAVFVCAFLRVSTNWTNAGHLGAKFLFLRTPYQTGPLAENHYFGFHDDDARSGQLRLMVGLQGGGDATHAPLDRSMHSDWNVADGRWHRIEVLWIAERPAGSANGIVRTWVDGILVHDVRDARFFHSGQERRWVYVESVATYGSDRAHAPWDMWWDVDHLYASVR